LNAQEARVNGDSPRVRELEAALAAMTARLEEREHARAQLERLLEISQMLVRFEGMEEVERLLVSMASGTPPLRRAVLVTSEHGLDHPCCWRSPEADEAGLALAVAQVSAALAFFSGSSPLLPREDERPFVTLPLAGTRGEILGALLLEWSVLPGEPELVLAGKLVQRISAVLERQWRGAQTDRQEDLLARVAHELRNLLSVIGVDLTLLLRSPELRDLEKPQKQLKRIKRSADRMVSLTRDLLDTASVEAESLPMDLRSLEVAPVVKEALEAASPLAANRSIELKAEIVADLSPICADTARVQQVFANLLSNAIKFSPDGGTIAIRAEPANRFVLFSVTDRGPGIPADDVPKLFHRFSQPTPTAEGTGLGLFIVKGIVKAHGGDVWVESEVGAGSTFFFTLPLA